MSARTVIVDHDGYSGGIVVDCPAFELVSISRPNRIAGPCIEIPLHLVPDVLTALMKAARLAAVDLPRDQAAGYIAARATSVRESVGILAVELWQAETMRANAARQLPALPVPDGTTEIRLGFGDAMRVKPLPAGLLKVALISPNMLPAVTLMSTDQAGAVMFAIERACETIEQRRAAPPVLAGPALDAARKFAAGFDSDSLEQGDGS